MNNIKFCEKLFDIFADVSDYYKFIIMDYYSLKVIQLLEFYDEKTSEEYSKLFQRFMEICKNSTKLNKYEMFFYALNNLLENKYLFIVEPDKKAKGEYIKDYINTLRIIIKRETKIIE